ncbi:MAG: hypothetical protein EOO75_20205 [Myxococcales bacterium]|nr:MAG: hypothetical protein EOO75_20205 [Myxococcales bacterium]
MTYEFLVLSLLFLVPGAVFALLRPDLRGLMGRMALASMPFAVTERLFVPAYWKPRFLFGLGDLLGFGLEDVIFVAGLGAYACATYPVVCDRRVVPVAAVPVRPWARGAAMIGAAIAAAVLLIALGVPVLYATVVAMALGTAAMLVTRRDLIVPGLAGALLGALVYLALCLVFARLIPGVFERTWRPSILLPGRLLGVPLDELLYGLGAGLSGTVFPAWAWGLRFAPGRPAS